MITELTTPEQLSAQVEKSEIVAVARTMMVVNERGVEVARDTIRQIKERRDKIDATFDPHIKAAHKAHKDLLATKKGFTDELDEAEKVIKRKIADHNLEEERKRKEEEEKARQEAERLKLQALTNAQKKVQSALSKVTSLEEQITELQQMREGEVTDTEREVIEREIEILHLKIEGEKEKAETAQQRAYQATEAVIPAVASTPKVSGVATKKVWNVLHIDSSKLISAIAAGKAPANIIKWDETAIKKAAALGIFYDGVQYEEDRQISVR